MLNNTHSQQQQAGDNSVNNQAQTITQNFTVYQGITRDEAREIALQVYKDNMYQLSQEARQLADTRASELTDKLIDKLTSQSTTDLLSAFGDPDMQYSLVQAQIAYARIGDSTLLENLISILVQRAAESKRSLLQIVLNESLSVLPKLTNSQLDTLSIVLLINHIKHDMTSLKMIIDTFDSKIFPMMNNLTKDRSCYQHLAYTGCCSISIGEITIERILQLNHPGLFIKGFDISEFQKLHSYQQAQSLLLRCLHDSSLLQLDGIDDVVIEVRARELGLDDTTITELKTLQKSKLMNEEEIKQWLKISDQRFIQLLDLWDNSNLKNINLTSVGIAIAIANIKQKLGVNYELSIWIK